MATQQEILDVLRRARERIADPTRWVRGHMAMDAEGHSTAPQSIGAVAWCAVGALDAEEPGDKQIGNGAFAFLFKAASLGWGSAPTVVNDTLGHAAALALYDRAIADAEAAVRA